MNDNVCDQIHNEWSKSSIYGGTKFVSLELTNLLLLSCRIIVKVMQS